jgi:hypothetical protein
LLSLEEIAFSFFDKLFVFQSFFEGESMNIVILGTDGVHIHILFDNLYGKPLNFTPTVVAKFPYHAHLPRFVLEELDWF